MSVSSKLKQAIRLSINVCEVVIYKMTHHNGKRSVFKTLIFLLSIGYLCIQPIYIIRAALATSFLSYVLNNFTNNVLDSIVEIT